MCHYIEWENSCAWHRLNIHPCKHSISNTHTHTQMGVCSHILLRAKRPCTENTTIIKQTMSVSFNEIKTARNVGASEEKALRGAVSLFCASVRHISLRAVCVCLSHARKHTPRALLRSVNVQCCVCIISVLGDFCQAGRVLLKLSNGCDSHTFNF